MPSQGRLNRSMTQLSPISVKQGRIVVSFHTGTTWSSADGGDIDKDVLTYNDTNLNIKQTFTGACYISNKVLKKVHDPIADAPLIAAIIKQMEAQTPFSVTIQPVKSDITGTPLGGLTTYPNCVLLSFKTPKYDREGSGVAEISIEVAVNSLPTF